MGSLGLPPTGTVANKVNNMCRLARSIDVVGLRGWARRPGAQRSAAGRPGDAVEMPPNRRIELAEALIVDNEDVKPTDCSAVSLRSEQNPDRSNAATDQCMFNALRKFHMDQ